MTSLVPDSQRFNRRKRRLAEVEALKLEDYQLYPPPSMVTADHLRIDGVRSLQISRETPIGSMGSCFARRIKEWLEIHGFNYQIADTKNALEHGSADWERVYNTPCVLQEITRLLTGAELPIFELNDGRYLDPWRKKKVFEDRNQAQESIAEYVRSGSEVLKKMDVFVITLGLSEVWFDNESGLAFSEFPQFPDIFDPSNLRLEFVNSASSLRHLEDTVRLLKTANSGLQIILTVSPVPLRATFFNRSVLVANSLSKSALLEAAIELSVSHADVHYFPSYEIALSLGQNPSFQWDGRHVTHDTVNLIMEKFEQVFVA